MRSEKEQEVLKVLRAQGHNLNETLNISANTAREANSSIAEAHAFLSGLGIEVDASKQPTRPVVRYQEQPTTLEAVVVRSWDKVLADAEAHDNSYATIDDVLDIHEIEEAFQRIQLFRDAYDDEHAVKMDRNDYMVCGIAGVLAGLADIFLVQVPRHPGFLGSPASEGGWLSNLVREKFGDIIPASTIRSLEREFPVPFDPSTSRGLDEYVNGLGPTTHRFQSLGHDPIMGWVVGVRDIINGTFTAISKDGSLITQTINGYDQSELGKNFFIAILNALQTVAGHLASDVATPAGLPAPMMPLVQFLQYGSIGQNGYTIGELSRQMYRSGYDFRHFVSGSIPTALIEIIVRGGFLIRNLHEGVPLSDALPTTNKPKLHRMLFLAHTTAAAFNAGKVAVTQNPLSISWTQWLAFFRYLVPEAGRFLGGYELAREDAVRAEIERQWTDVYRLVNETFAEEMRGNVVAFAL